MILNLVEGGGLITQLAVVANARSLGILTNAQQAAAMLRRMAERGELVLERGKNSMGETEYRKI